MKCDETAVTLLHPRQFDDEQCKPFRKLWVTVTDEQCPQSKVVCSQTLASGFLKQEQFMCAGCCMMAGIERWESHECKKPGQ